MLTAVEAYATFVSDQNVPNHLISQWEQNHWSTNAVCTSTTASIHTTWGGVQVGLVSKTINDLQTFDEPNTTGAGVRRKGSCHLCSKMNCVSIQPLRYRLMNNNNATKMTCLSDCFHSCIWEIQVRLDKPDGSVGKKFPMYHVSELMKPTQEKERKKKKSGWVETERWLAPIVLTRPIKMVWAQQDILELHGVVVCTSSEVTRVRVVHTPHTYASLISFVGCQLGGFWHSFG